MNSLYQWVIRTLAGVSSQEWRKVLDLVLQAAGRSIPNSDRKQWVIDQLNKWLTEEKKAALKEGVVNFLIEAALRLLKNNKTITT